MTSGGLKKTKHHRKSNILNKENSVLLTIICILTVQKYSTFRNVTHTHKIPFPIDNFSCGSNLQIFTGMVCYCCLPLYHASEMR